MKLDIEQIFREKIKLNRENNGKIIEICEKKILSKLSQAKEEYFLEGKNTMMVIDRTRGQLEGVEVLLNGNKVCELPNLILPNTGFYGLENMFEEDRCNVERVEHFDNPDDDYTKENAIVFEFNFDDDYGDYDDFYD